MAKQKGVINFVLIGAKRAGKTRYILHLAKEKSRISTLDNENNRTKYYIDELEEQEDHIILLMSKLKWTSSTKKLSLNDYQYQLNEFSKSIQGTPVSYTELYFNYKDNTYNIDFQMDDYDGNFVETWSSTKNKELKDKLTKYVKESEGIFVFLPYENKDTVVRFDKMQKETNFFINKIKEIYGEDPDLPIPLIIVVSKWDRSPPFKDKEKKEDKEYQNKKAKEYIEDHKVLKDIKKELDSQFKKIDIIPLSSAKDYNITLPIEIALDSTFKEWEEEIGKLEKDKKEKELRVFLNTILYDIRHYKNGKYKKRYKELVKKENWRRGCLIASAVIVLAVGTLGYSNYKTTKGEKNLFYNIQTEFENKNYSAVLSDIKIYNVEYNSVDEKHHEAVKLLEEQAKAKYRVDIGEVLAKLPEIKSAVKAYGIIGEINIKAKEYGVPPATLSSIQKKFFRLDEINGAYNKANEEIDKLSLESISKEKIDDIASNKSKLVGFTEYQILEKKFDAKIQTIVNASLESDDEDRLELMLDIASSVEVTDDKIAALKERLHGTKVDMQFNELIEQLKRIDTIADLTNKISTDWSAEYDDKKKQIEIRNLVETKYNEWVKKQLKREAPQSVNSIDDYSRLDTFAREGINMQQRIEGLPVKISISKSVGNKKVYDEKLKLFQRYKEIFENGVATTSLTLHIPKNNSLGITSFDDRVSIFLNGRRAYRCSDSNGFRGKKIVFNHRYKYKAQRYALKIKEEDLFEDDYANENFTITNNKLIELENSGRLHIKLGNGYEIDIYK